MIQRILDQLLDFRDRQRILVALGRGAATLNARYVDVTDPGSWEFSGFSQNGEDGLISVLRRHIRDQNRYFIEIGAADGVENNSSWLAIAEKLSGLMIEGDRRLARRGERLMSSLSVGVEVRNMFVGRSNAHEVVEWALYRDPDVFSLDIDGMDFYVAEALFAAGLRPKIAVVEYNSAFGPDRKFTVKYADNFDFRAAHPSALYYGVSVAGWREFFGRHGYRFITVDRNGVNAVFVCPEHFDGGFVDAVRGRVFAENWYQLRKFRVPHEQQFRMISELAFVEI